MTNTKQWIGYRITKGNRYYIGVVQALKWDRPVKAYTHPRHGYQPATPYYLGGGHAIREAIIKHGAGAFKREILARFDNVNDAEAWERANVVMQDDDPLSYNLQSGGKSGFKVGKRCREKHSIAGKRNAELGIKPPILIGENNPQFGKPPANAFKSGKDNPQFGKPPAKSFKSGKDNPNYGKSGKDHPTYNHGVARTASGRISRAKGAITARVKPPMRAKQPPARAER